MVKHFRLGEYKVLGYRILLAYLFYFIARVLFYLFNAKLLKLNSISDFFELSYYGLAFDTTAILYVNLLFIVFSILPFKRNTSAGYQRFIWILYFATNFIAYATNFVDLIYYKFTYSRTTTAVLNVIEHEVNLSKLFVSFIIDFWYVFVLYFVCAWLWIYLYRKVKIAPFKPTKNVPYYSFSFFGFLLITTLVIGGIRGGDFKKSTRPINLLDANRHVKNIAHADIVLNTPFAIIRTLRSNSFVKTDYEGVTSELILEKIQPIKTYKNNPPTKPNVVMFILESNGREYYGSFNKKSNIKDFKTHTPFLDSLAQHAMIYTNAYSNGRQSIHGMSSVLAGIPSFKDAFTSSPFPKQKIESLVSTLESEGYKTSFFHGAANGSMGFLGFANILGIDKYYGRTEYNDDSEFDGFWGIWDEPFLQFMKKTLDKEKSPFFSTVFTVSSHEPFNIPSKYKKKFPKGDIPIHKCVEYTDYSVQRFFAEAKKSPWFANTIFVFVADHANAIFYKEYTRGTEHFAIPIMIYQPNSKYVGVDEDLAQQIDIYPTILDMIGYQKPFRSWGRSLLDKKSSTPFVMNSTGSLYQFSRGNYICIFDGSKSIGFYAKDDKALLHNLIARRNAEMNDIELNCKAFIQDYMERVVDQKLTSH